MDPTPNSKPVHESNEDSRMELILAMLEANETPEASVFFQERMKQNPDLVSELNAYREALAAGKEWLESEAPGADRVETLPIPALDSASVLPLSESPVHRLHKSFAFWRRIAATAAVFAVGFLIGLYVQKESPILNESHSRPHLALPKERQEESTGVIQTGQVQPTPRPSDTKEKPVPPESQGVTSRLALLPDEKRTREENGKMIIETTLKASGIRAIWVVDGNFEVQSSVSGK